MVLIGGFQISYIEVLKPYLQFLKHSYTELGTSLREYATKMDPASHGRPNNVAFPPSNPDVSNIRVESKEAAVDEHVAKHSKTEDRTDTPRNLPGCREAPLCALVTTCVYSFDRILEGQERTNGKKASHSQAASMPQIQVRQTIKNSRLCKIY